MTIDEIIEGCRIGGVFLEQRLKVIEYSTIPRAIEETRLIRACLRNRARKNEVAEIAARLGVPGVGLLPKIGVGGLH